MPSIGKGEKLLVYGIVICIDLLQIVFSLFVVTEPFNHIIDIGVGVCLAFYGLKRRLFNQNKVLVLAATFFAEQIPFVNALPFWTFDVYNLYKGTSSSVTQAQHAIPRNYQGVRRPNSQITPANHNGMRQPRKNQKLVQEESDVSGFSTADQEAV